MDTTTLRIKQLEQSGFKKITFGELTEGKIFYAIFSSIAYNGTFIFSFKKISKSEAAECTKDGDIIEKPADPYMRNGVYIGTITMLDRNTVWIKK